jgi:hypothetical protein
MKRGGGASERKRLMPASAGLLEWGVGRASVLVTEPGKEVCGVSCEDRGIADVASTIG